MWEVRGLTKSYPSAAGALRVLKDMTFSLAAGSTCAIVGPSGSGKTTLLGLCAGLDQPTAGGVPFPGPAFGGPVGGWRGGAVEESRWLVFTQFTANHPPTRAEVANSPVSWPEAARACG